MEFIIAGLLGVLIAYFFSWARKRGAYYNGAERELQRMKIDSSLVDKKYGRGKYHASLEYMRAHGLSPEEAAKAIAADLSGEYNDFLERLNAEGSDPSMTCTSQNAGASPGQLLVERIRTAHNLSAQLAETLGQMSIPKGKDIQSAREFAILISSFIGSLESTMGVQIEDGSIGKKLADAFSRRDFDDVSDIQIPVMKKVHQISGADRSDYVFQLFWPMIHKGLSARP